jgi:hypothetical protein
MCEKAHYISQCSKFLALTNETRWTQVARSNYCTNCLSSQHTVKSCRAGTCRECRHKHQPQPKAESQLQIIAKQFKTVGFNRGAQLLGSHKSPVKLSGITGKATPIRNKVNIKIKSQVNHDTARLECLVVPKITDNLPSTNIDVSSWKFLQTIALADT